MVGTRRVQDALTPASVAIGASALTVGGIYALDYVTGIPQKGSVPFVVFVVVTLVAGVCYRTTCAVGRDGNG
jgi:hypothetical protein